MRRPARRIAAAEPGLKLPVVRSRSGERVGTALSRHYRGTEASPAMPTVPKHGDPWNGRPPFPACANLPPVTHLRRAVLVLLMLALPVQAAIAAARTLCVAAARHADVVATTAHASHAHDHGVAHATGGRRRFAAGGRVRARGGGHLQAVCGVRTHGCGAARGAVALRPAGGRPRLPGDPRPGPAQRRGRPGTSSTNELTPPTRFA